MNKPKFLVVIAIIIAAAITSWKIQQRAAFRLHAANSSLLEQAGRLAGLKEERTHLSNLVAHAKIRPALSEEQFRELLRLRGEVGRLRLQGPQMNELQATNQALRAALAHSGNPREVQARWTRDELNFAGYDDPESAMISTLWALDNDPATHIARLTPQEKALLESEGRSEQLETYFKKVSEMLNPSAATGISLIGKKLNSPDEVMLDLYYEGEGKTRRFLVKRIDGAWRLQDLVSITAN
jgi:hypothetical protein